MALRTIPSFTIPAMPITMALKSLLSSSSLVISFLISSSSISIILSFGVGTVHSDIMSSEMKTEKFVVVPPKSIENA